MGEIEPRSFVTGLSCPRCARRYDHRELRGLCSCGAPLLVDYDLEAVAARADRDAVVARPPTMWRFGELLPVEDPSAAVSLGEGFTPLIRADGLARTVGVGELWVKDDGLNPTGTFKARGASCGISRARELGVADVALATAGNAGAAWACYGATAGIGVHVAMPADAPLSVQLECRLYGAEVMLVDGLISDAARVLSERIESEGWFDVSTLKEPYRIEGKKTLGFELAEQFEWSAPDAVVYPAGGGVGLIGIWRAFQQLRAVGWVAADGPRLIITQAEGCAPLVKAFDEGREESEPWPDARTVAAGLRVPKALGDFLVLRAVRETGGNAIAVSDGAIAEAMVDLAHRGISASPEGAATLAAARRLRERGDLTGSDRVVLINTGTGLKDPEALAWAVGMTGREQTSDQSSAGSI